MKKARIYLLLHGLLLVFSLAPVFSKLAGQQPFLSPPFLLFYALSVGVLGVYAIAWQQVIKRMPLTTAYANRAVAVVWGMVWGLFIFGETITLLKLLGAAIIVGGVVLFATAQGEEDAAHD